MFKYFSVFVAVCSLPIVATAQVEEPRGSITLRRALALVLERSPELRVFDYDLRIADARILQSKLIPNPELNLTSENLARSRVEEDTLLFEQLIELGGKRAARMRVTKASRALAEFDYETKKREVFLKTAEHFIDLLAAQRRIGISEELVRLANDFAPAVQRRLEIGKTSDLEKTRFDIALASARIELEQSRRDAIAARQRLAAQWGSNFPRFTDARGDLEATPETASFETLTKRLASNPRLARFGADVAQREAVLAREKAAAIPDVTLQAGPRRLAATDETAAVIGLSIPLPFWNRNQGNIQAAREEVGRAEVEKAAVTTALMTELNDSFQSLARARVTVEALRRDVLPGAEAALKSAGEGYEAGRYTYLDVLEARRSMAGARLQYIEALIVLQKASFAIEALTATPRRQNFPNE